MLIHPTTTLLANSGYQEIIKIHSNSQISVKNLTLLQTIQ